MVYKRAPYQPAAAGFGAAAARTLRTDGLDVVRLGVIYSAVEPKPGVFSSAYVASIETTVRVLASQGVYSLLDFHQDQMSTGFGGEGFPNWSVDTSGMPIKPYAFPLGYTESAGLDAAYDNFWADKEGPGGVGLQQRYAAALRYVAKAFASNRYVLGYDVFNEPWPAHASTAELGAFYERVIAAIRSVDAHHLIFYEPYVTFDFGVPTTLEHFADGDLGMSFHDYCLENAATDASQCSSAEAQVIRNALARSRSTGDALVLSEFGATNDLSDLARVVSDADGSGISWIEWSYCGCDDPTGSIPPSVEGLVANPRLPGVGSNVDQSKLAVLAEPYPRVVSGTPLSYSFDDSSHTFAFRYSTRSPGGRAFPKGSCTAVVVPPFQYPHGYSVHVTGATVSSSAGAGVLTLSQSAGAKSVSVNLVAGSAGRTTAPVVSAFADCR